MGLFVVLQSEDTLIIVSKMFYKFNPVTQNVSPASNEAAVSKSVSVQGLAEPTKIHTEYKTTSAPKAEVQVPKSSGVAPGGGKYPVPSDPRYKRFMDLQTRFLASDGKLVWQKLPRDKPIYGLTVAGVVVATVWSMSYLKFMATPPKNG